MKLIKQLLDQGRERRRLELLQLKQDALADFDQQASEQDKRIVAHIDELADSNPDIRPLFVQMAEDYRQAVASLRAGLVEKFNRT
jgi:hypothetical protein